MGSKWFSKLGIALAGIAMVVGVGVGLGQKELREAKADNATLSYTTNTTTNMNGTNQATTVGLTSSWSVIGSKGSASNYPGLNKEGNIRLYYNADGSNYITVSSSTYWINSITVSCKTNYDNFEIYKAATPTGTAVSISDGSYTINGTVFCIYNSYSENKQVHINSIVINYSDAYTVTYNANGGTVSPTSVIAKSGSSITLATPTYGGYDFDGWQIGGSGGYQASPYTVTGNVTMVAHWTESASPYVTTPANLSGFTGKTASLVATFDHLTTGIYYTLSNGNISLEQASSTGTNKSGSRTYTVSFTNAGSTTITFKDGEGGSNLATCSVSITATAAESLSWDINNISGYVGMSLTELPGTLIATWNNGDEASEVTSGYTLTLGESELSLPHTWEASDNGKAITVTLDGHSDSAEVTVVQNLNTITRSNNVSTLTFTAVCGGTGVSDEEATWTVTSDAEESTYDANKGIHYGTGSASVSYLTLSTSGIPGTITKVVVNASGASKTSATIGVKVNSVQFGDDPTSITSSNTAYTFEGSASGAVEVQLSQTSATKALYVKSIEVSYTYEKNIANQIGHIAAQAAVVTFVQAFNNAMNGTNVCSGTKANRATAWATASDAYDTLISTLTSKPSELAFAKAMINSATASWNESHDSDQKYCLERAMATYEYCVAHYADCAEDNFLVDGTTPLRNSATVGFVISYDTPSNNNTLIAIIIIAGISTLAIGGYFFIRRKHQ